MSVKVDIDLVFVWSITEKGEPHVDLVPKNRPNDIKSSFTFDEDCFIEAIQADIENNKFEPDEWLDIIHFFNSTAEKIKEIVKEEMNDDN